MSHGSFFGVLNAPEPLRHQDHNVPLPTPATKRAASSRAAARVAALGKLGSTLRVKSISSVVDSSRRRTVFWAFRRSMLEFACGSNGVTERTRASKRARARKSKGTD